jgi:hypothetical protein
MSEHVRHLNLDLINRAGDSTSGSVEVRHDPDEIARTIRVNWLDREVPATGHYPYHALQVVREQLEEEGLMICCFGWSRGLRYTSLHCQASVAPAFATTNTGHGSYEWSWVSRDSIPSEHRRFHYKAKTLTVFFDSR